MSKKRILIVEDSRGDVQFWLTVLGDRVEGVHAMSIEAVMNFIEIDQNFDMIVMDCCVPGSDPNTMELVRWIRNIPFTRPILANSSVKEYTKELVKVGASHECRKDDVPQFIVKILQL